jgi:hypothetical protein
MIGLSWQSSPPYCHVMISSEALVPRWFGVAFSMANFVTLAAGRARRSTWLVLAGGAAVLAPGKLACAHPCAFHAHGSLRLGPRCVGRGERMGSVRSNKRMLSSQGAAFSIRRRATISKK